MAKKITGYIKITVGAGKANPAPPVGSALGQRGVNIMEFCKAFNAATQSMEPGIPVPVMITVYADKSFDFVMKTPAASYFLKKYAKIEKGSAATKKTAFVGQIKKSDCVEIAKIKMPGLNANDIDAATKIIVGSAESMGLEVIDG
jgi:large subunit ribosomal protein L11